MKLEKRGEVSAEEAAAAEAAQETVQAEQTAGRKKPVLLYLVILFAIALFLILFSFLAQNRVNAMEMQEMQAEVDAARELQVKYEQSQAENASLRTQLEEANALAAEEDEDAVAALMNLGFTRQESTRAVERAKAAGAVTVEEVIAAALRGM